MKRRIDRAWSVTIAELRQNQSDLEEAIRLCEKHRKSFFFHGYKMRDRNWREEMNSMVAKFVVYTLGELEIDIETTYSSSRTYFNSLFLLNGEKRDLKIARKALKIINEQIEIKIELGAE
jgi:hypothetical protein